jgi:hypothetical protein
MSETKLRKLPAFLTDEWPRRFVDAAGRSDFDLSCCKHTLRVRAQGRPHEHASSARPPSRP